MKEKIHPVYHEVTAHCSCGSSWKTRSTSKELRLEICSSCHPYFTGKAKLIDTAGRVERFQKRYAGAKEAKEAKEVKEAKEAKEKAAAVKV
jgi:large subunit ribosomal protein L31